MVKSGAGALPSIRSSYGCGRDSIYTRRANNTLWSFASSKAQSLLCFKMSHTLKMRACLCLCVCVWVFTLARDFLTPRQYKSRSTFISSAEANNSSAACGKIRLITRAKPTLTFRAR